MTSSLVRQHLRRQRQKAARASLMPEQIKTYPKAAKQYALFSGKRGHGKGRPFEDFVRQHEAMA